MRITLLGDINSSHTKKWISSYLERGIEVQCISINPSETVFEHANLNVVSLGVVKSKSKSQSTLYKWSYLLKINNVRKALASFHPDHIHAHFASSYGLLAMLSLKPYYISLWGSDILNFPNKNFLFKVLLGRILKQSKKVFSTSHFMAEKCFDLYKIKPIVIPFGIDIDQFLFRQKANVNESPIIIGTVKALERTYGIDILIRSFALAIKECDIPLKLIIIGDGSLISEYKNLSKELYIEEHIEFKGRITHEMVPKALSTFDLFANLSRQESFGVSVLEASAVGLPVIVSDIAGLKEVYVEQETGICADIKDINDIKQKILYLAKDEALRKSMGINGRNFVERNFDWNACVDKQLSYYSH